MPNESADEDQALDAETRRTSGLLLAMEERPRDLGGEGFAENPAGGDVAFEQCRFNPGGVVIERPVGLARIGGFDEARAVVQRVAKGREKSPVAVEPGKVDEGWFAGGAVKTELETFVVRDGGNVMRKT